MPVPMRINKIRYWDEEEIERLERERMTSREIAGGDVMSESNITPTYRPK